MRRWNPSMAISRVVPERSAPRMKMGLSLLSRLMCFSLSNGSVNWSGGGCRGLRLRLDPETAVGVALLNVDRNQIRLHCSLETAHAALFVLFQMGVAEPLGIVALGKVDTVVVEPPTALAAEQRGARRHLGAVADRVDL